jgi:pimeloyl-ACP methyl ester carboxylesterase
MTAFVLVGGPFTGGWVWDELAARLRESGRAAWPVTLDGSPGAGLSSHVAELLALLDRIEDPRVVLVGHDYGIHPVLGAADRRPERISRIVYVAAGLPQDGGSALLLVRDEAVSRLDRLAVPEPAGTFTEPLRLTGAVRGLPSTGVLCTADGPGIDMVEMLVRSGPPRFKELAGPRVTFFELPTGHWPMMSRPGDLAEVLLRAAAGEGHRIDVPDPDGAGDLGFLLDPVTGCTPSPTTRGPRRTSRLPSPWYAPIPGSTRTGSRSGSSPAAACSRRAGSRRHRHGCGAWP